MSRRNICRECNQGTLDKVYKPQKYNGIFVCFEALRCDNCAAEKLLKDSQEIKDFLDKRSK